MIKHPRCVNSWIMRPFLFIEFQCVFLTKTPKLELLNVTSTRFLFFLSTSSVWMKRFRFCACGFWTLAEFKNRSVWFHVRTSKIRWIFKLSRLLDMGHESKLGPWVWTLFTSVLTPCFQTWQASNNLGNKTLYVIYTVHTIVCTSM